jgi:hypothetical protein
VAYVLLQNPQTFKVWMGEFGARLVASGAVALVGIHLVGIGDIRAVNLDIRPVANAKEPQHGDLQGEVVLPKFNRDRRELNSKKLAQAQRLAALRAR